MSAPSNTGEETALSENIGNDSNNSNENVSDGTNNNNSSNRQFQPRRYVTIQRPSVVYGPPRPSSTNNPASHETSPSPRNNNEYGNSNNSERSTTFHMNMVPGQPLRMRVINGGGSNASNSANSASAASAAAFAALHHPHVRASMARHASRVANVQQSTADNTAGQPQVNNNNGNSGFRHNASQRISIISQSPMMRASTSSSTASLPPLEVQPLPYSSNVEKMDLKSGRSDICNNKDTLQAFLKKMECRICFEYMDSPVGCPNESCDARFCSTCLHRSVASNQRLHTTNEHEQRQQQQQFSKCPCCRKEFPSATFITPDVALKQQIIANQITTTCPFPNCQERIPLANLKNHEKTCEFMPMRCKYCSMGCAWTGPKRDVAAHTSLGCAYAKINGLVDKVRKCRVEQEQMTQNFNQQMAVMRLMIMEQGQLMAKMQTKNTNNVLDLLHLTYTCTCHTHHFLFVGKPMWKLFYYTPVARATVTNFLCLLPWLLWVLKIFTCGVNCLLNMREYYPSSTPELTFEAIENITLSFALMLIGFLLVFLLHVDDGNSMEWAQYRLPSCFSTMARVPTSRPLLRDSIALASAGLCFTCIEFDEYLGKRLSLWLICLSTCTIFPPIVANILKVASQRSNSIDESSESIIENGKAHAVILFGAKYGFLASLCDFIPSLDALLLLRLIKKAFNISDGKVLSEETDCMINDLDKSHFLGYLAVARISSVIARSPRFDGDLNFFLFQTFLAILIQLLVNQYIMKMSMLGQKIGSKIAAGFITLSQQNQSASTKINSAFFFGPWIILLGCILIS